MNEELKNWTWFEYNFQWIGLAGAFVILYFLFGTDRLRSNKEISNWRDYTWLSWIGMSAYLFHNVEEYGIDLYGNSHGFPIDITALLETIKPSGNIPGGLLYMMVNVPAFWITAPIAAILSRKYPLTGLTVYSIISINIFMHLVPFLFGQGYSAGLFTAVVLFLPLCGWTFYVCFGKGRLAKNWLFLIIGLGILLHAVLMAAMFGYVLDIISYFIAIVIEALNTIFILGIIYFYESRLYKRTTF